MKPSLQVLNLASDTAEVRLYGDIGGDDGISATDFCAQFDAIKAAKIDLRINSKGGDCFEAFAMCTSVRNHPGEVTAKIDGIAASCGSFVAAACDRVEMSPEAFLMIHDPKVLAFGDAAEMRQKADMLGRLADSIAQIYSDRSGKSKDVILAAMHAETWFNAAEAKAYGLADEVMDFDGDDDDDDEDDGDAQNSSRARFLNDLSPLLLAQYRNVPAALRRLAVQNKGHRPQRQETSTMLKITSRDGKNFVTLDGKEHEIEAPPAPAAAAPVNSGGAAVAKGKSDEEVAAAVKAGKEEAVRQEREYRKMFDSVLNTAGLDAKTAEQFNKLYGRPEDDLKIFASLALGVRAKPVGEGSGTPEVTNSGDDDKKKIAALEKRFADNFDLRRSFGVLDDTPGTARYQNALKRYIASEARWDADKAAGKHLSAAPAAK